MGDSPLLGLGDLLVPSVMYSLSQTLYSGVVLPWAFPCGGNCHWVWVGSGLSAVPNSIVSMVDCGVVLCFLSRVVPLYVMLRRASVLVLFCKSVLAWLSPGS